MADIENFQAHLVGPCLGEPPKSTVVLIDAQFFPGRKVEVKCGRLERGGGILCGPEGKKCFLLKDFTQMTEPTPENPVKSFTTAIGEIKLNRHTKEFIRPDKIEPIYLSTLSTNVIDIYMSAGSKYTKVKEVHGQLTDLYGSTVKHSSLQSMITGIRNSVGADLWEAHPTFGRGHRLAPPKNETT
jgi:hypothetical protein